MTNSKEEVEEALRLAINAGGYPIGYVFSYFQPGHLMKEDELITCGELKLHPIHVRGHSP